MKKFLLIFMLCPLLTVMSCRDNTATSNETAPSVSADANLNSMEAALEKELYASYAQMPMQVDYATTLNSVTRDDTVMIDRWHNRTKVDTVYRNFTEYVHDTVRVKEIIQPTKSDTWTLKDDLIAFLIGFFMLALVVTGAKIYYTFKYK